MVPWPGHQARDGGGRAQRARVRQRDRCAGEVVGRQLVASRALHQLLVARVKLAEFHAVGALDHRHHQEATPVPSFDVHGEAQVDRPGVDAVRRTVEIGEVVRHAGLLGSRTHDRPADEVREAHLARSHGRVQLPPAGLQDAHLDVAEARGGRQLEGGDHVADQPRGRPLDGGGTFRQRRFRQRRFRQRRFRRRALRVGRSAVACVALLVLGCRRRESSRAALELVAPLAVDRCRVAAVLLVKLGDVAGVDAVEGAVDPRRLVWRV